MGRIRTIKPEFWTDEKVVQLPYEARLLFIGMWNFADDEGFIADEPQRIKMEVLPADNVDPEQLIDLLCAAGMVEKLDLPEGRGVLFLPHFSDHQRISHKTKTKFPVSTGKKRSIPESARREVAIKYGCKPGEVKDVECYYCGESGRIHWHRLSSGRASAWVSFSGLEIDHLVPENSGGETTAKNLVLSCRYCNRSKGTKSHLELVSRNAPENSGGLTEDSPTKGMEGNGMERKGREGSVRETTSKTEKPNPEDETANASASPKRTSRKPATRIPEDWRPGDKDIEWIRSFGVSVDEAEPVILEFRGYWQSRKKKYVDWSRAFRGNSTVEAGLIRIAKRKINGGLPASRQEEKIVWLDESRPY